MLMPVFTLLSFSRRRFLMNQFGAGRWRLILWVTSQDIYGGAQKDHRVSVITLHRVHVCWQHGIRRQAIKRGCKWFKSTVTELNFRRWIIRLSFSALLLKQSQAGRPATCFGKLRSYFYLNPHFNVYYPLQCLVKYCINELWRFMG